MGKMQGALDQPGDPKELVRTLDAMERHYERSRKAIVMYWDVLSGRFQLCYLDEYEESDTKIEVVEIP